ncbi:MAG: efflux RND transporter permease subunit [Pseudomonadota bacterium]
MKADQYVRSIAGLSVRRPWLAVVANLLIVIAGISAVFGIDVRELPNVDRPIVSVRANYPGASPTTVDAEATSIVENAVARVEGVVSVRSSSEEGNFRMRVEFRPDSDLIAAANDVREAISRVARRLPAGVEDLYVVKSEQDAWPIMRVAVWSTAETIDQLTRRVEDEIIPELTGIEGVAEVVAFGDRQKVLRVEVAPERLAAFGLSVGEVADVLRSAQFDVPVGSFRANELEVLVRADASVVEPGLIEDLIVRDPVRLGDLAEVYFSTATPESFARVEGRGVISLGIVRQASSNTMKISSDVNSVIDRLRERIPELQFQVTSDDAVFIRGAVQEVITTLLIALAIVVVVIFMFTGSFGATLVPAVAIPVALIGSLAVIWLLGYSLNLVTLLAMVLATGLVVDDAIVVLENIQRRRAEGMPAKAAAVVGTQQVFFAVIATTATLVAVFIPISFLPSEAGRIFSEFGFILAATVVISSFVALTLCPMIASLLPSLGGEPRGGPVFRTYSRIYAQILRPVLRAPLVSLFMASFLAATSFLVYTQLGEELVPDEDRGFINVRMQGPDGVGLDHTDRQVQKVENMLQPFLSDGTAASIYSVTGRFDLNRGQVVAQLAPWAQRDISQGEIEAQLQPQLNQLPGARARISSGNSLGLRGSAGGGIELALTGPSYPAIAEAAEVFAERLEQIDGISDIRIQYQATQPQLSLRLDRARISDLGIRMDELSSTLRALIDEEELTELTVEDEAVPIILQSRSGAIRDPTDLLNLFVRSGDGRAVSLSQIVSLSEGGVAAELDRHGQRRAIEIDASIEPTLPLRTAVDQVRALALETLPPGIGVLFLGEAATLEETSSGLQVTFAIAMVVIFLVLVAQFESLTSATVVMLTVPFGIAAAVYAMWITGVTLNIYSQIGVLLLIGVMAKNGILLVEFADQLRDKGASPWDAAKEAALVRLRPITMTLVSTVLAGLPLILSSGPGSEARAAIGWVVFGGLGLAAGFTLFLTPAAYALVAGLSRPRAAAGQQLEKEIKALDV